MSESAKLSRQQRANLKELQELGAITPHKPGKKRTTYKVRVAPERDFNGETYPGFHDHPSETGIEYQKSIDQAPTASVWEALANECYAGGGVPLWIRKALSQLDVSVYWQLTHYQFVNDNTARMSIRTLSRNLWVYRNSIRNSLAWLSVVGLIVKVKENKGRRPAEYKVISPYAVEWKELPPRRSDSGFNPKSESVEDTAQNLEDTAQNARGNRAVSQKTNPPLGGELGEGALHARPTNSPQTKKKTLPQSSPMTIDAERKQRQRVLDREKYAERPALIRTFYENETSLEILTNLISTTPALKNKFNEIVDINSRLGKFNKEAGKLEAGTWSNPKSIYDRITFLLRKNQFDVRNIAKVLDDLLSKLLRDVTETGKRNESEFQTYTFKQQQEREAEERRLERERIAEDKRIEAEELRSRMEREKLEAEQKAQERKREAEEQRLERERIAEARRIETEEFHLRMEALTVEAKRRQLLIRLDELRERFISLLTFEKAKSEIELWGLEIETIKKQLLGFTDIEEEIRKALADYFHVTAYTLKPEHFESWFNQTLIDINERI